MSSCSSASSVVLDNGSPWTEGVMDHSTTPILSSAGPERETDHPRRLLRGNRFQQPAWPTKRLADRIVAPRALTWSAWRVQNEVGDVGELPARPAYPVGSDRAAAIGVPIAAALWLFDVVLVAPPGQGPDDWPEPPALRGQHVLVAAPATRRLGQDSLIDEQ